jgi:hypothetical protein
VERRHDGGGRWHWKELDAWVLDGRRELKIEGRRGGGGWGSSGFIDGGGGSVEEG